MLLNCLFCIEKEGIESPHEHCNVWFDKTQGVFSKTSLYDFPIANNNLSRYLLIVWLMLNQEVHFLAPTTYSIFRHLHSTRHFCW